MGKFVISVSGFKNFGSSGFLHLSFLCQTFWSSCALSLVHAWALLQWVESCPQGPASLSDLMKVLHQRSAPLLVAAVNASAVCDSHQRLYIVTEMLPSQSSIFEIM